MADETTHDDPAVRIRQLEADLAAERERASGYESTLKTLEGQRRQPSSGPRGQVVQLTREQEERIMDTLGWDLQTTRNNAPQIATLFGIFAEPVLGGINGLVDHVDHIDARTDMPDWKDVESHVDRIRKEHIARGEFITRKKAAALYKAERMQDPKYLDELAERRAAEKAAASVDREAERTAATVEGGKAPTQTAGPSPTKGKSPTVDRETFDTMPLDEKRKHLNESGLTF